MESNIYDLGFFRDSQITLKIKGKKENIMFNTNFKGINSLKEVHINGQIQNGIPNKYNFDQEYNSVELILDDNIDNTENMFKDCASITEINLSAFDSSKVTSMDNMFEGCSSLTSIDLSNLKTSSVKRMNFMFSGCPSLTSLHLSYFDTSSVTRMDSMFSHCS
jgi:surface protein